jgi:hypothetical protein
MRVAIALLVTLLLIGTVSTQEAQTAEDQTVLDQAPEDQVAESQDTLDPTAPEQDAQNAPQSAAETAPQNPAKPPAKDAPKNKVVFSGGINLGSDVLLTGIGGAAETWTRFGFQPDLSFGKIGVGLDLTFHFVMYKTQDAAFTLYQGDWIPSNGKTILDVYLPKILYVRYGLKGEDPLFVKLGSINDLSLGNGFIMSDYSNMHFLPQQRIFGLDVGLDGALFDFPYAGFEALTGNLAQFDVVGGRVYARPLIGTSIPILKNMQVGATVVADAKPDLYAPTTTPAKAIAAYGADVLIPILGGKTFPLVAFTDVAMDPNQSTGWMLGFGGRLLGLFTYGAQLRVLQEGFIPAYFDANYDIYRAKKFSYAKGSGIRESWYATIGTSLFTDKFVLNTVVDGPFAAAPTVATGNQTDYPHLRGIIRLNPIEGFPFFFDGSYDKYFIGAIQDLVDPTNAIIGLNINYKTGASILTLAYDAKWDPAKAQFNVTSSLQASMKF